MNEMPPRTGGPAGPTPEANQVTLFAHPSEEEFARILDFYRLKWLYEPRSFPLQWEGDIVDTGMTLNYLLGHLATRQPRSIRVCTLLDKRVRRLVDVPLEYVGFEVPDEFVVGYGLDYEQK